MPNATTMNRHEVVFTVNGGLKQRMTFGAEADTITVDLSRNVIASILKRYECDPDAVRVFGWTINGR